MNKQSITIKGSGKLKGSFSDLDMAVYAACNFASIKRINNKLGIAKVTYLFEGDEDIHDWVKVDEIEKYNCLVVSVNAG